MLIIGLFHAGICGGVLGFFLHVVHRGVGNVALDGDGVAEMIGERNFVALDVPRAAVVGVEDELVGATSLR